MENTQTTKATGIVTDTVQVLPKAKDSLGSMSSIVLNMANFHSDIPPWGTNVHERDIKLGEFWRSEDYLASAIHAIAMTRSALSYQLTGPPKSVDRVQKMLQRSDFNRGFISLIGKVVIDLLSSDNGAHIELIRKPPQKGRKPESGEVIAMNHLPTSQCYQTGDPLTPIIYKDSDGKNHMMKWYQVIRLVEIPIPDPDNKNFQFCFVSRVLNFATTIKAVLNYNQEKITGRFSKSVSVISGVSQHDMDTIQEKAQIDANQQGLINYSKPIIMSTLDPSATVSSATIDLAGIPDGFDFSEMVQNYILLLSMGSGVSQIDLGAPIFSSSLGSSEQSGTLIEKSRVKSLLLFMKSIETALVNSKAIPPNVRFKYVDSDGEVEERTVEVKHTRAKTREIMISDGTITAAVARQMAVDDGDLNAVYLAMMGDSDEETITINDNERVSESDTSNVTALEQPAPEPVPIEVSDKASRWITDLVHNSPINSILPISHTQLKTFQVALRNRLHTGMIFGTDSIWMDTPILYSAKEAGIDPMLLIQRLPENYKLAVSQNSVVDSRGSIIYVKEQKKDASFKIGIFLEDLSFANYDEKLRTILAINNAKVSKEYLRQLHKIKYFNDISMLRVKLLGTYYKTFLK